MEKDTDAPIERNMLSKDTDHCKQDCNKLSLRNDDEPQSSVHESCQQNDQQGKYTYMKQTESPLTWFGCLRQALFIWLSVAYRSTPKLLVIVLFMWLYYVPSRILTADLLESISHILYDVVRNILSVSSFCLAMMLCFVELFGFNLSLNAFRYFFAPVLIVSLFMNVIFMDNTFVFNLVTNTLALTGIVGGLYLVSKTKSNPHMSAETQTHFQLTKDGTPIAVLKGVIGLFVLVIFLLQSIFPIYLSSTFYSQLVFRFFIFPLCFALSKWYQVSVIFNLSKEHMHKRLIINKISNYYMHIVSRLYLSNLTTRGSNSSRYILVNFASAVLEIGYVLTVKLRLNVAFEVKRALHHVYCTIFDSKSNRIVSIVPLEDPSGGVASEEVRDIQTKKQTFIQETMALNSGQICDDISSEIYSIFIAPLVMYFLFKIYPDTPFQTISTLHDCFSQVFVQLVFEFLGDVISLTFQLRHRHIQKDIISEWVPINNFLLVSFSVFCILFMHRIVTLFS